MIFEKVKIQFEELLKQTDFIAVERKDLLEKISHYIAEKALQNQETNLMYVCTHNSRRSHFGQIWAAVAASFFDVPHVRTFSGGTEATAFHPNAIEALRTTGFVIVALTESQNPNYQVKFGTTEFTTCFSKVYDDSDNPCSNFAAIMTCSDAEENCPFIPGVELRIGTTYDDPKVFDGTALQAEKYRERSLQIGKECAYVFSKAKQIIDSKTL